MRHPLLAAALALPALAHAEVPQCRLPPAVAAPALPAPDGPRRVLPIAGYTLALSWSPEYCRTRARDPRAAFQCGGKLGRFGFILHGLWPESTPGNWPQWCPATPLSAETVRRNLCMTPSPDLIAHEWAKHGACMASSPEGYFRSGADLLRAVRLPDMIRLSRQPGLTAGDLRAAFSAATPSIPAAAIRIRANGRGWLDEVHICYGKDLRPASCADQGAADTAPLKIWRGR
ncbi:ribonuclease T(2) [Novosphingobium sediminis]|uniref:Ribonuclease T(2) n=1 Tax=Novosphingobium sediminis TaxID=707214 RepID=A0A512AIG4_9SPHN|nr:ribonuclease T2 [Novosphingobium sediminis]GEN99509.1 ribonuclease T(2) [Novosphingobium sediminis]